VREGLVEALPRPHLVLNQKETDRPRLVGAESNPLRETRLVLAGAIAEE
jgi:hypothetical protein